MNMPSIAVIGGSGFYDMPGLENARDEAVETPFGAPSDEIRVGTLDGVPVAFLPRHGRGHRIPPVAVNSRANIWALKTLGVRWILSVSAVGSMREHIHPLDVVVPDQLVDHTRHRKLTFFDDPGLVVHVGMGKPFSQKLSAIAADAAEAAGGTVHRGGSYLCIEGPQFSSQGESELYRSWGMDIIGMTAIPEARLAREAEICYAVLAMVTDYDVWHESEQDVSAELVIQNLARNTVLSQDTVREAVPNIAACDSECECATALETAIVTAPDAVDRALVDRYQLLVGKYLGQSSGK
ncbi:MAG: S-methyl-5'-thioadenosine phosphorylase [Chloroflexi bacterium]|nr:S-methyl-5'-thioadenosine phosphorylase [Chloroflexota bacterium]HCU73365.1 S-methyl-5'-thioadenosine phosphorylase [Chloroflexota bacterium]